MMTKLVGMVVIAGALVLAGCNTVAGAGRDVSSAGRAVTKAAQPAD